jgi:hypothetical protein
MRPAILLVLASAGIATACASTETPYQTASGSSQHGFTEYQIENNRLRLTFSGNSSTEMETVKRYILYRAAEVTLERGYDYFIIVGRELESDREFRTTGFARPRLGPVDVEEVNAYTGIADIAMYRGAKPDFMPNAFDARDVQAHLARDIVRPESGKRTG